MLAGYSCRLPQHIFALICGENLDNELAITPDFVLLDIAIIEGQRGSLLFFNLVLPLLYINDVAKTGSSRVSKTQCTL